MQKWKCANCGIVVSVPHGITPDEMGCSKNGATGKHAWYKC